MSKQLKQDRVDLLVSSIKSVIGVIPFAGPFLSELVGNVIPNQRVDRLTAYVLELEKKLSELEGAKIEQAIHNEECVDLIEESFLQASRALSPERRSYIANVVANGINDDTLEFSESKYVLTIIKELNEQEIIWLRFFQFPTIGGDEEFRNKHKNILTPIRAYIGGDERTLERADIQESHIYHLERLGLIASRYSIDHKTGLPEFNKISGKQRISFRYLTPLGKLVLKQVGLYDDKPDRVVS